MITKIGLIAGEILTLLEKENGPMNFNYLQSSLRETDYLIWMSLGSLLCERYINTIEKCATVKCKNIGKISERKSLLFNENQASFATSKFSEKSEDSLPAKRQIYFPMLQANRLAEVMNKEPETMARHIFCVGAEILSLLEACQGVLSFETIGASLNEPKEDILMALGWLIRQGYVHSIGGKEIIIFRLPKETADLNFESLCQV